MWRGGRVRLIAHDSKSCRGNTLVGSNPTLSVFLRIILNSIISWNGLCCSRFRGISFGGRCPIKPMLFDIALVCAGALSLLAFPAQANQMFRAGGSSGTSCPSGAQYRGSGFCRATKPNYQFFRAGGSSGTSCPSGSQYKGNGFCLAR